MLPNPGLDYTLHWVLMKKHQGHDRAVIAVPRATTEALVACVWAADDSDEQPWMCVADDLPLNFLSGGCAVQILRSCSSGSLSLCTNIRAWLLLLCSGERARLHVAICVCER